MSALPKLSIFHRADDGILSCLRDRVRQRHLRIVDTLDELPTILPRSVSGGLDLVGHGDPGLFRFGPTLVDASPRFVALFRALGAAGVSRVRLLGCKVGADPASAQVLASLVAAVDTLEIQGSVRELVCADFGHDGLRATAEADVLGTFPDPNVRDAPFPLLEHLDENPRPAAANDHLVTRDRLAELQRLLSADHSVCCPGEFHLRSSTTTVMRFALAGGGRGRVVARTDGRLYALAERKDLSPAGAVVEVVYPIAAEHTAAARALVERFAVDGPA